MAAAKYSIAIPKHDALGNPLKDIASVAHHYLYYGPIRTEGAYVDPDKLGHWLDDKPQAQDMLVAHAEDNPETDSLFKQLAHHVGEVVNRPQIFVTKEGKNGLKTWTIANSQYQEGQPASQSALL
jgi:hypothetical protein